MINLTNIIFNFFDQLAIEKVNDPDFFKLKKFDLYDVFIRVFELVLVYSFFYVFIKFSQFILALLIKIPIEHVNYFYYGFPLLLMIETGLSKTKKNIPILTIMIFRALIKVGVVFSIDILVYRLIKIID